MSYDQLTNARKEECEKCLLSSKPHPWPSFQPRGHLWGVRSITLPNCALASSRNDLPSKRSALTPGGTGHSDTGSCTKVNVWSLGDPWNWFWAPRGKGEARDQSWWPHLLSLMVILSPVSFKVPGLVFSLRRNLANGPCSGLLGVTLEFSIGL